MGRIIRKYQDLAIQQRGTFLNHIIDLEKLLSIYIASYFCSDSNKQKEFLAILTIGLKSKVESAIYIIDNYDTKFKVRHPNFKTELRKFVRVRNTFAHGFLDIMKTEEKDGKLKTFFINGYNAKTSDFGKEEFDKLVVRLKEYNHSFLYRDKKFDK